MSCVHSLTILCCSDSDHGTGGPLTNSDCQDATVVGIVGMERTNRSLSDGRRRRELKRERGLEFDDGDPILPELSETLVNGWRVPGQVNVGGVESHSTGIGRCANGIYV